MVCIEKEVEGMFLLYYLQLDSFWGLCCCYWSDVGEARISDWEY